MSISTESINSVIEELQTIKWLLIMLVFISIYFTFLFFMVLKKLQEPSSLVGRQLYTKKKQAEFEDLLAMGNATAVKFAALEWIANQPGEPYAHWFLAKSVLPAWRNDRSQKIVYSFASYVARLGVSNYSMDRAHR